MGRESPVNRGGRPTSVRVDKELHWGLGPQPGHGLLRFGRRFLSARARQRLRRALIDWLQLTWTTRQGIHLRVATYNEWIIYNEIFVDGEYDAAIQRALDRLPQDRPAQVLDLGANVGFFTLRLFDRLRAREIADSALAVTLVEADPAVVPVLNQRLRVENRLDAPIRVLHGVVGSDGPSAFYPSPGSPGDGSIVPTAAGAAVTVPVIDLGRDADDLSQVDLMKCDIEGAELRFFEQSLALLSRTAILVVEIHTDHCPVARCREILGVAGLTRETVLRDRGGCALHLYTRHGNTEARSRG